MLKQFTVLLSILALFSPAAMARDDRLKFPLKSAMEHVDAQEMLNQGVKFYFGDQKPKGKIAQRYGNFSTHRKANGVGKSDQQSCERAFLSSMLSLQDRALREGANAVINIKSNYKNVSFSSSTEYECGAGNIMAGVVLTGDVVKLQ